jgi:phospholipid transport system substrate-binding protein
MRLPIVLIALGFCLGTAVLAAPVESATTQVKSTADKVISILKDANLQGDAKKDERHRLLRQELEQRFDWNAICRSCLGRHWAKLAPNQRTEFIDSFKEFLERTYLDRIEPYYNQLDHIDYRGERIAENNYASVKTVVFTKEGVEHPVEYRLEKSAGGVWRVYDVVIEGVSLVKNYRSQFDDIIAKSGYESLLNQLKTKTLPATQS